jgi:methionyl-tRNA synthetase
MGYVRSLNGHLRTFYRCHAATGVGYDLREQTSALHAAVDQALARYDFRTASEAIIGLAECGNQFIEAEAPWHLAKAADAGDTHAAQRFEAVIDTILAACRVAADELTPFIPDGAIQLAAQLE